MSLERAVLAETRLLFKPILHRFLLTFRFLMIITVEPTFKLGTWWHISEGTNMRIKEHYWGRYMLFWVVSRNALSIFFFTLLPLVLIVTAFKQFWPCFHIFSCWVILNLSVLFAYINIQNWLRTIVLYAANVGFAFSRKDAKRQFEVPHQKQSLCSEGRLSTHRLQ